MSIKIKNLGDFTILLSISGRLTTSASTVLGSGDCGGPAPFSGIVKAVYAVLGAAGTGAAAATVDLLQNETTMVASGAMFSFASTATTPTYTAPATNPPTVTKGDIFSLAVNSVHNTTPAQDLCVAIVLERTRGTGPVAQMLTGTYGSSEV